MRQRKSQKAGNDLCLRLKNHPYQNKSIEVKPDRRFTGLKNLGILPSLHTSKKNTSKLFSQMGRDCFS
ncbi:hypothetical protein HMPREF1869_01484 [Bacteroidales bacterium KA00251]|nr:hypothetical protein HMPREF1869_01484 [Bacteroidales bacterium KA00251]